MLIKHLKILIYYSKLRFFGVFRLVMIKNTFMKIDYNNLMFNRRKNGNNGE